MSYFNALYNISTRRMTMAKRRKDARSIGQLAVTAVLCWFMEPVLSEFLAGRGPDEDDGEEWEPWLAQQALANPLNMIPVVRDAVNYFIKDEVRSFSVSPAISGMEMILKAGAALGNAALTLTTARIFGMRNEAKRWRGALEPPRVPRSSTRK